MRNVAMRNRESEGHTDSAVEDSARAPLLSRRRVCKTFPLNHRAEYCSCAYRTRAQHALLCRPSSGLMGGPNYRGLSVARKDGVAVHAARFLEAFARAPRGMYVLWTTALHMVLEYRALRRSHEHRRGNPGSLRSSWYIHWQSQI